MYDEVYRTKHGFVIPDEHIPSDSDMIRYRQGDDSMVEFLVNGLTHFVVNEVEWFLKCTETAQPYTEDCVSEALLSLTEFVTNSLGKDYSVPGFLSSVKYRCLNDVRDWLREMSIAVTIPAISQRKGYEGTELSQVKLHESLQVSGPEMVFNEVWFDDFMSMITGLDQDIVRMRIQGLSNREIGENINMHHQHVEIRLERLRELYQKG